MAAETRLATDYQKRQYPLFVGFERAEIVYKLYVYAKINLAAPKIQHWTKTP
jgi:hypothetical protein